MKHWKYKAYDASGEIKEGHIDSASPQQAILTLRQRGLQVFDLVTAHRSERRRERTHEDRLDRLQKLRDRIEGVPDDATVHAEDAGRKRAAAKARRTAASYYWWNAALAVALAVAVAAVAALFMLR